MFYKNIPYQILSVKIINNKEYFYIGIVYCYFHFKINKK